MKKQLTILFFVASLFTITQCKQASKSPENTKTLKTTKTSGIPLKI